MNLELALLLFGECARLSLIAFGGATALLPELARVVVTERQWMGQEQFAQLFAIAQAAPGPNVLVVSLIGWQVAGVAGALAATLGLCLPMSVVVYLLAGSWDRWRQARWRRWVQLGVAPLAAGLVAASGLFVGQAAQLGIAGWVWVAVVVALMTWKRWHPLWYIALGALLGLVGVV